MGYDPRILAGASAGGALLFGLGKATWDVTQARKRGQEVDFRSLLPGIASWAFTGALVGLNGGYVFRKVKMRSAAKAFVNSYGETVGSDGTGFVRAVKNRFASVPERRAVFRQAKKTLDLSLSPEHVGAFDLYRSLDRELQKSWAERGASFAGYGLAGAVGGSVQSWWSQRARASAGSPADRAPSD